MIFSNTTDENFKKNKLFTVPYQALRGPIQGAKMDNTIKIPDMITARFSHQLIVFTISAVRNGSGIVLQEICLLNSTVSSCDNSTTHPEIRQIGAQIIEFLDGDNVDFSEYVLEMSGYSDFQRRVLTAARALPRGTTVSYAELARMAGHPGAFRAAASVMRKNRFPLVIPCHRVIKGSGEAGGYGGETEGRMAELKMRLIEMERRVR